MKEKLAGAEKRVEEVTARNCELLKELSNAQHRVYSQTANMQQDAVPAIGSYVYY
jgi:hypothetical protein